MNGHLALVGGQEWSEGCTFDEGLLAASGADQVLVLPTAAAYERPARRIERAEAWFATLGAGVTALGVFGRKDAFDRAHVDAVSRARFVYLSSGNEMHLRAVLKDTPLWDAIADAWRAGTTLAASAAGAQVLCEHMVDSRGGAFTVGLGLIAEPTVIPRFDLWSEEKVHRTVRLAAPARMVVGVPERTALIREPDGSWRAEGVGEVVLFHAGEPVGLDELAS